MITLSSLSLQEQYDADSDKNVPFKSAASSRKSLSDSKLGVVCIYLHFGCGMYLLRFLVWYVFTYISGVVCIYLNFWCDMYLLTFLVWYVFTYISGVVCIYLHF